jgi:hypothetical protein
MIGAFIMVVTLVLISTFNSIKTNALSGSDFNAGNIISDSIFYNKSSMSPQLIQQFLNSKVPICDTNGTRMYNATQTRAQWAAANGRPTPPYICLKDYSQTIPSVTNSGSNLCKNSIVGGTKSAAQIIWDVSQACGINPQVLIVMLQKEMSLVTDDWPWPNQYDKAMGYACPDSGPNNSANCDSAFFGFFNQVYNAAQAYRRYEANPSSYNYRAGRNNFILYNPNISCGGTNIFIQNQATASLYIYTPYQPNAAALNNLYGTGDDCSAYGNRNFWRLFNDWFGSTTEPANYKWSVVSQIAYTDNTMTNQFSNYKPSLNYRDRAFLQLRVRNDGNVVWNKSVKIGTFNDKNRNSKFCDQTWLACSRPTAIKETFVSPGEIATFEFWITAPEESGQFTEHFNLLMEDVSWFPTVGLFYPVQVNAIPFYGVFTSEKFYTDSDQTSEVKRNQLTNNRRYYVVYKVKNIGTETWTKSGTNPVRLGSVNNTPSDLCDGTWLSCSRPANIKENSVTPGQTATFEFWIRTDFELNGVTFPEKYKLLIENVRWFDFPSISTTYRMNTPNTTWQIISQTSYEDSSEIKSSPTNNLDVNEERYIVIRAKNLSGSVWRNNGSNPIRLATNSPRNSSSLVCHEVWIACNRPATMEEAVVNPGETATFKFWIRAKDDNLNYNENYILVSENKYWLGNAGLIKHYKVEE